MTQFAGKTSLIAGALAAIGASVCCVGPLVLLALGISGSWIGNLSAMEPYRPIFIGLTLMFLGLAFRQLYWALPACESDAPCADPETRKRQRIIFWAIGLLLLGVLAVPLLARLFY